MAKKKTTYKEANAAMQGSPVRWIRIHPGAPLSLIPQPGSQLENELYKELTPAERRAGKRPVIHFGFNFGNVKKIVDMLRQELPEDFQNEK
jgi:hypothetical protein